MTNLTWEELSSRYCGRQDSTPEKLHSTLLMQALRYEPIGWMLLECQMMDSSLCGSLTILPFGPNNTWKQIPTGPVSPRGLASDMSTIVGVMLADKLPA